MVLDEKEVSILTSGTNGGFASFVSSLSHSIPSNQGWFLISSNPLGPHPKRFFISRSQNYIMFADSDRVPFFFYREKKYI